MKEFFAAVLIIFLALVGFVLVACMFVMLIIMALEIAQHFRRKRGYRKGKESFVVIGGDYVAAEAERGQHECTTSTES